MAFFRHVDGKRAGPNALGILVPPGRRTLIILRPRALEWDLLPLRPGEAAGSALFWELNSKEAATVAGQVSQALEEGAGGAGPVEATAAPGGSGYQVRTQLAAATWVACPRVPGRPYQPAAFATPEEAQRAADLIAAVLRPAAGSDQELYVNTHHFSR
jgi:hypothetical protein